MLKKVFLCFLLVASFSSRLLLASPIVLLGPPLVGKGTLAHTLAQEFSVPHVSTGDLLRDRAGDGTEMGRVIQERMSQGELVPVDVVGSVLAERLAKKDCAHGYILDGYPRSVEQAEVLEELVPNFSELIVIVMEAPEDVLVARGAKRRMCSECGKSTSVAEDTNSLEGLTDHCSGSLTQRQDDREDIIRHRLQVYREQSEPVRSFFKRRGVLNVIDAEASIEEVHHKALDVIHHTAAKNRLKQFGTSLTLRGFTDNFSDESLERDVIDPAADPSAALSSAALASDA